MQKKLIALAVAAVISAPAYAEVSVYGIVDAAVARLSADGQKTDMQALSSGLAASRFGVTATEELDGGMKAIAQLEYQLDSEVNATVGTTSSGAAKARRQMLALAGGFGTVATGYLPTTGYDFAVKFDPTAGSVVSPLQNVTQSSFLIGSVALAARAQRALAYISPDFNGLSFAANYSTALSGLGDLTVADTTSATGSLKSTAYLLSGNYTQGPLNVGLVYAAANNYHVSAYDALLSTTAMTTLSLDVTEFALGASYDLGVAKLLGTYQSSKQTFTGPASYVGGNSATNTAMSLSGVIPVSAAGAVVVTYAKNTMDAANTSASGESVAYLHSLSKTTTAYAAYSVMSQDSGSTGYSVANNALVNATAPSLANTAGTAGTLKAGGGSSIIAVGLQKKF